MEQKEQLLEAVFGTMRSRQGIQCHVATSPRRNVGSTMQKSTTSPRRDVTTLRRHHVATSARKSASHHLMPDGSEIRASGAYDQRHGFPEPEDPDFERVPGICTAFHFC